VPLVRRRGRPPAAKSSAEIRHCSRHGWIEFHHVSRGADRKVWRCKRCVGEAVTRRNQKLRKILVTEAGGRCVNCGYARCIINLTFHHRVPSEKSFSMSAKTGRSLAAFREEARKCVLLCANCHADVEAAMRRASLPQARARSKAGIRPIQQSRCRVHGITSFGLYGRKQPRWRCKQCIVDGVTRRRRQVRKALLAAAGGRCAICGYARVAGLQFHHVDPATKSFDLGIAAQKARAAYLAELGKCVLVCANCHGEIETEVIACPPAATKYVELARRATQLTLA